MNRTEILDTAEHIISHDREREYGAPDKSFKTIAMLWTSYLGVQISPHDVAMMMMLLKVSRAKNGMPKEDTYVDIAGYAALAGEIATLEAEPED